jgi:hypothetical protein
MSKHETSDHIEKHQTSEAAANIDLVSLQEKPKGTGEKSTQHESARTHSAGGEIQAKESAQTSQHQRATNAEASIIASLQKKPEDLLPVFAQLTDLQGHESALQFKQDLSALNADLQKKGILPGLEIIADDTKEEGFSVKEQQRSSTEQPAAQAEPLAAQRDSLALRTERPAAAANQPESKTEQSTAGPTSHFQKGEQGRHSSGRHHAGDGGHHARHHAAHGSHRRFAGGAYDGVKAPDQATLSASIKAVLAEAKAQGLSEEATRAAVASMLVESQGNPLARGDGNTSFGLFQLHRGGELTEGLRQGKLASENDAFDPAKNARVALSYFRQLQGKYGDAGKLAAAAQRPRDRSEYADKVNSLVASGQVDQLIQQAAS